MHIALWLSTATVALALMLDRVAARVGEGHRPPRWSTLGLHWTTRLVIVSAVLGLAGWSVFDEVELRLLLCELGYLNGSGLVDAGSSWEHPVQCRSAMMAHSP